MTIKNIVRVTTHDTKKTYEFPFDKDVVRPQLWAVRLGVAGFDQYGRYSNHFTCERTIVLERETLENAGLLLDSRPQEKIQKAQKETAEDLILRLLELVQVYPVE